AAGARVATSEPSRSSWGPAVTACGNAANEVSSGAVSGRTIAPTDLRSTGLAVGPATAGTDPVAANSIGAVVALIATGADDRGGVIATTMRATAITATIPPAKATTWEPEPESTSTVVGASSDGCLHVRS